jgi:hypothetical protein
MFMIPDVAWNFVFSPAFKAYYQCFNKFYFDAPGGLPRLDMFFLSGMP